jgi:hypothetical protein
VPCVSAAGLLTLSLALVGRARTARPTSLFHHRVGFDAKPAEGAPRRASGSEEAHLIGTLSDSSHVHFCSKGSFSNRTAFVSDLAKQRKRSLKWWKGPHFAIYGPIKLANLIGRDVRDLQRWLLRLALVLNFPSKDRVLGIPFLAALPELSGSAGLLPQKHMEVER